MIVKICDAPGVGGGRAIMLCDVDGNELPNQTEVYTGSAVGDLPTVTVTFIIDGNRIKFADEA